MRRRLAFTGLVAAALLLGAAPRTDAIQTDLLWLVICSAGHPSPPDAPEVVEDATALPPMAPCGPAPSGFHVLPSVGGAGDVTVTLAVGADRTTARLCYVGPTLPEAPVIRVAAGHRLTINLVNTISDPGPDRRHSCMVDTYVESGPCLPKPRLRAVPGPDGGFYPIAATLPHLADGATSLLVHGLPAPSPPCAGGMLYPANWPEPIDAAASCQKAPNQITETIDIPADHPSGLDWYGAYRYGESEPQTMMGLAGAIVVTDAAEARWAALGVTDLVLVVRDQPVSRAPAAVPNGIMAATPIVLHLPPPGGAIDPHVDRANEVGCAADDTDEGGPEGTRLLLNGAPVAEAENGALPPDAAVPATTMAPGQRQLWRILNASADTAIAPRLVLERGGVRTLLKLAVVARDGARLTDAAGHPRIETDADPPLMAPGSRLEILVRAPPPGATLYLDSDRLRPGCVGDGAPARRLLRVTAGGAAVAPGAADDSDLLAALPIRPPTPGPAPSVRRRFTFSEYPRGFTVAHARWPDGSPRPQNYDPAATDFFLTQTQSSDDPDVPVRLLGFSETMPPIVVHLHGADSVTEQWTLTNATLEAHAFHLRHMRFREVTGTQLDTLTIPPAANANGTPGAPGERTVLVTFTRAQIGTVLFQCAILAHADNGMMGRLQVVAD